MIAKLIVVQGDDRGAGAGPAGCGAGADAHRRACRRTCAFLRRVATPARSPRLTRTRQLIERERGSLFRAVTGPALA